MELPKSKMTIAVGAVLGVAAIAFVVHMHNSANAASAAASDTTGGGFPTLLYTSGAGASTISTGGGVQSDPTTAQTPAPETGSGSILAALQAAIAQIGSAASQTYNTNYTDLFAQLPDKLNKNNLDALDFKGTQGADGTTSLIASVHYRDNAPNYTDVVPNAPAPTVAVADTPRELSQNDISLINTYASNRAGVGVRSLDQVVNELVSPGVLDLPEKYKSAGTLKGFIQQEAYYTTYLNRFLT